MPVVTTFFLVLSSTCTSLPRPRSEVGAETGYAYSQYHPRSKVYWGGLTKTQSLAAADVSAEGEACG